MVFDLLCSMIQKDKGMFVRTISEQPLGQAFQADMLYVTWFGG
jgi:hypothetical protein